MNSQALLFKVLKFEHWRHTSPIGVQQSWLSQSSSKLDLEQILDFLTPRHVIPHKTTRQAHKQQSGMGLGSFAQLPKPNSMSPARPFRLVWGNQRKEPTCAMLLLEMVEEREQQEFGSLFKHLLKKCQLIFQGTCSYMWC